MGLTGQEEGGECVNDGQFRVGIGIVIVVHWGRNVASRELWGIIHYRVINKGYALSWYWCIHWRGGLNTKRQSAAEHLLELLDLGCKSLILVFHLGRLLHLLCECKSMGLVCKGNCFVLTERFVEFPVEQEKFVHQDLALACKLAARFMLGLSRAEASEAFASSEISNVDFRQEVPPRDLSKV